jgi:hypothetical protein
MSLCSNYCYKDQHMCSSELSCQLLLQRSTHMFLCTLLPITATMVHTCVLPTCHTNYCYKDQHICSSAPSYLLLLQWYTHVFFRPVIPITAKKINTYVPLNHPAYYCYNSTHMCYLWNHSSLVVFLPWHLLPLPTIKTYGSTPFVNRLQVLL